MTSESTPKGRILVIENEQQICKLICDALKLDGHEVSSHSNGEEGLAEINNFNPHLIMLDNRLPGMDGKEVLEQVRQMGHYISVIFVSAQNSMKEIIHVLDSGADDYIAKPFILGDLLARVRSQLRMKHLHDELSFANSKLQALVDIDDLTGLYNMRSTYKRIEYELQKVEQFKLQLGIVMLDMDHFKKVNDNHDHLFGSFVLSEVGKIIKNNIRIQDFGVRYGGDEFMIVITDASDKIVKDICEKIRKIIEAYDFRKDLDEIKLTCSIGYTVCKKGKKGLDAKELVRLADKALYESKEKGRNFVSASS